MPSAGSRLAQLGQDFLHQRSESILPRASQFRGSADVLSGTSGLFGRDAQLFGFGPERVGRLARFITQAAPCLFDQAFLFGGSARALFFDPSGFRGFT